MDAKAPATAGTARGYGRLVGVDMIDDTCSVKDCGRPVVNIRGWCSPHYQRWRHVGDVQADRPVLVRRPGAKCSIEGCGKPVVARGWCSRHWNRWRTWGDPLTTAVLIGDDVTRFWTKTEQPPGECWPWRGTIDTATGYGTFSYRTEGRSGTVGAHRRAYELSRGAIPDGLTLDHRCHTTDPSCLGGPTCLHRRCVNPDHLEPVPAGVNALRGLGPCAQNARKTHCKRGHEFTADNTLLAKSGARVCRACKRAYERAHPRPGH